MSHGQFLYLVLVIAAFATFIVVLATVSWSEQRRRK
jgi:hypothetical protein